MSIRADGVAVDRIVHAVNTIDVPHHEIHEGEHYIGSVSAATITTKDYLVTSPADVTIHMTWELATDGAVSLTVYEAPTATVSATKIAAVNNNRQSTNTSSVDICDTPTAVTPGTGIIYIGLAGSGQKAGGTNRSEVEFLLKKNTKYLFRCVGTSTPNMVMRWSWYEEGE